MYETISVIIPAESYSADMKILKCLDEAEYPKDKIEIIIAVGKKPSLQRNEAVKTAKGDILYFFNRDTQVEPDIFKKAVDIINSGVKIAGAGGPDLTPPNNNDMQHIFGYAMGSYFMHWKMRARYSQVGIQRISDEKELLLSNIAIRKDVFLKAGCFNERLYPNEENELINRIHENGYKFIYSPELKIYRDRRKTLPAFMKQFYRYGRGRMEQVFTEGVVKNWQFFAPLAMLFIFTLSLLTRRYLLGLSILGIYFIFAFSDALYIFFRNIRRNASFIFLPFIYAIMHISYALGMIGALSGIFKLKDKGSEKQEVLIRVVKAMNCDQ